jgi:hypothetical protein
MDFLLGISTNMSVFSTHLELTGLGLARSFVRAKPFEKYVGNVFQVLFVGMW